MNRTLRRPCSKLDKLLMSVNDTPLPHTPCLLTTLLKYHKSYRYSSSSSSIDSSTLGGCWSVQQFYSIPVCPLPSPSNQFTSFVLRINLGSKICEFINPFKLVLFYYILLNYFIFPSRCLNVFSL